MDKIEKAHKQWMFSYYEKFGGYPDCAENAAWAFSWCEKHLVTDLHNKRLNELGECFTKIKKLERKLEMAIGTLESIAKAYPEVGDNCTYPELADLTLYTIKKKTK